MALRHQDRDLGCWYPLAGVDRLCRHSTDGSTTGLCATHQRVLLHPRLKHFVDLPTR